MQYFNTSCRIVFLCMTLAKAGLAFGVSNAELRASIDVVSDFRKAHPEKPFIQPLDPKTKALFLSLVELDPDTENALSTSQETRGVDILHAALSTLREDGAVWGDTFSSFAKASPLFTEKPQDFPDRLRAYFGEDGKQTLYKNLAGDFFMPVSPKSALLPVSVLLQGALEGVFFVPITKGKQEIHHFDASPMEAACHDVLHGSLIQDGKLECSEVFFRIFQSIKTDGFGDEDRMLFREAATTYAQKVQGQFAHVVRPIFTLKNRSLTAAAFLKIHESYDWPSKMNDNLLETLRGWLTTSMAPSTKKYFDDWTSFKDGSQIGDLPKEVRKDFGIPEDAEVTIESRWAETKLRWMNQDCEREHIRYTDNNWGILNTLQEIENILEWAKGLEYTPFERLKNPSRDDYENYARGIFVAMEALFENASKDLDGLVTQEMSRQYQGGLEQATSDYKDNLPERLKKYGEMFLDDFLNLGSLEPSA